MVTIKIIVGSTRPNRFGPQLAEWLLKLSREHPAAQFELLDLKEINLPFLDEPEMPSDGNYQQEHTKQWAATIAAGDGFIWVHPEYNHSVAPALKNAIDFLWQEWNNKPVALAGYGAEAGGARAAEQLRLVASAVMMFDIRTQLVITSYRQQLDANGIFQPTDKQTKIAHKLLDDIIFWAEQFKRARQDLADRRA